MLETNRIYNIDVMDGLKLLDDNSIDLIITSPPYNKAGFNGIAKRTKHCIWNKTIDYGGDINVDNMNEEDYEQWQIDIVNSPLPKVRGLLGKNIKQIYCVNKC